MEELDPRLRNVQITPELEALSQRTGGVDTTEFDNSWADDPGLPDIRHPLYARVDDSGNVNLTPWGRYVTRVCLSIHHLDPDGVDRMITIKDYQLELARTRRVRAFIAADKDYYDRTGKIRAEASETLRASKFGDWRELMLAVERRLAREEQGLPPPSEFGDRFSGERGAEAELVRKRIKRDCQW